MLTETHGSWSNQPASYAYQWEDCDSAGANCVPIVGATHQTYTPTASDVGATIVVLETATNAGGTSQPASSLPTAVVLPLPPVDSTPPGISGDATEGQTLTESHGLWSNTPTAYTYQWVDCDPTGANCTAITAATHQTYVLSSTDVGHTIRVLETASNGGGAGAQASSTQTAAVQAATAPAARPANTSVPRISGKARVGRTLKTTTGAWSGTPPLHFAYEWERCVKRRCTPIIGGTTNRLRLKRVGLGDRLRVLVTAINAVGRAQAISAKVGPVAPSVAMVKAAVKAVLVPTGAPAAIGQLLANGGYSFSFRSPSAGRLTLSWSDQHPRTGDVVLASLQVAFSRARRATVRLRLTAAGRRLLTRGSALTVTAIAEFTPTGFTGTRITTAISLSAS